MFLVLGYKPVSEEWKGLNLIRVVRGGGVARKFREVQTNGCPVYKR